MIRNERLAAVFAACAALPLATMCANAQSPDVQALRADTQVAEAGTPPTADSCLQGLDRPVVDGPRLIARCTTYLNMPGAAPGEPGAAHLARAAAIARRSASTAR